MGKSRRQSKQERRHEGLSGKEKKLYEQCPNEASGIEVQDLERDYQEKKRIAKELVKKKRWEEREALIKECQGKGGY